MSRGVVNALLAFGASLARYEEPAGLPDTLFGPDDVARRLDAVDAAQPYHRRQSRNLAHEEGVRVLAEAKRERRRARNRALRAAAIRRADRREAHRVASMLRAAGVAL